MPNVLDKGKLGGVKAKHKESVPVKETFQGQTVWDRVVEVFEIEDDPKTNKAYARARDTDDPLHPRKQVTALHIPSLTSPEAAVRAAIVQEQRNGAKAEEN
jgi:hypothetical protein